jgi:hypothetical protein
MKTLRYLIIVLLGIFIFTACAKEFSFETGSLDGRATGSLKNLGGDCQDITINGQYIKDSTLRDSSYVTVQVNFTTPGLYNIYTDTANGFSFRDSGYMVATGLQSVKLKAVGQPVVSQPTNFTVFLDTSYCMFTVNVTNTPVVRTNAVFTMAAAPVCGNASVQGSYQTGTALNATNKVTIQLNVTSPGAYNISTTTTNGMTFAGQGIVTTGTQTVTLNGSGTPLIARTDSIPITAGGTSCKFPVVVNQGTGQGNSSVWSFTQAGRVYSGNFDSATSATIPSGGMVFALYGSNATSDTTFTITMQFPGTTPSAGTFNTNAIGLNSFSLNRRSTGAAIFSANATTTGANTVITVTSYDATTKTFVGTFTGTAFNATNVVVPITAGTFRAVLQ